MRSPYQRFPNIRSGHSYFLWQTYNQKLTEPLRINTYLGQETMSCASMIALVLDNSCLERINPTMEAAS